MESFLYNKQRDLYTFYNDRVRWVIVFIELRYKKFPVPLLNEIRAAQDHVTRCYEPDKSDNHEYVESQMTDGEMRAMLEQRKVVQARIYHKDSIWHCFYFTFKGLYGLESGSMGSQPHYHYLSDKSGISWEELADRIKKCDMPTSKVHIIINKDYILTVN